MRNPTLALILAAILAACGPKGPREIPVLDVTASYPAKNLVLQDIAGVEYIPLETREGFFADMSDIKYMDEEIIVTNNRKGDIIIFDRHTGKGLTSFNRVGRGPGEFPQPYIHSLAVDRDRNEIYVSNGVKWTGEGYPIIIYDLDGKHLRTLGYHNLNAPAFFHSYDDGHLFFSNPDITIAEAYALISKTDTIVNFLPIKFEDRNTMTITQEIEGGVRSISTNSSAPVAKTREGYMLSEPGVDTIFHWNRSTDKLIPVMARTPYFNSMKYPIGLFYLGESSDYMFLRTVERKWDFDTNEGFNSVPLIYDKQSGEFFEGTIVNSDFNDQPVGLQIMPGVPAGVFVVVLQPYELLDLHEQGKLRGRLAEVAPTLKEDDNPVIMIVTFK
jgi:predicted small lipoprotein YifL